MCRSARALSLLMIGLPAILALGCNAPHPGMRQSQLHTRRLWEEKQMLAAQNAQSAQSAAAMAAERERIAQEQARLQAELETERQRIANLQKERGELHDRMATLISQARNQQNPLSAETTRRFEELSKRFPEFEFDPHTGVSKFHTDILFASGSADLKPQASPVLREFAQILNEGEAQRLNILVVGHTDDQRIAKPGTAQKHPTNWHLSTNRANSVILELARAGLKEGRMGSAGYSMHQPVAPNSDDASRGKNRRVEIYVLAPDAVVAGWDPQRN
ncbi:MAG: OmpA family protein [Planctomycetaceae bacterium]